MHGTKPPCLWRDFVHQFGDSPYIYVAGYFCNKKVLKVELVERVGDYSGLLPQEKLPAPGKSSSTEPALSFQDPRQAFVDRCSGQ